MLNHEWLSNNMYLCCLFFDKSAAVFVTWMWRCGFVKVEMILHSKEISTGWLVQCCWFFPQDYVITGPGKQAGSWTKLQNCSCSTLQATSLFIESEYTVVPYLCRSLKEQKAKMAYKSVSQYLMRHSQQLQFACCTLQCIPAAVMANQGVQ